jgi:DNA-binding response OmpR family regulator
MSRAASVMVERELQPILILQGDHEVRELLSEILTTEGHRVLAVGRIEHALTVSRTASPGLVLVDGGDGLLDSADLVKALLDELGDTAPPAICLSSSEREGARALLAGATKDLRKPFPVEALLEAVRTHRRRSTP